MTGQSGRMVVALGLTAVYAVCFVAIKAGLAFAPPLVFAGLRAEIAGAALLGIAILLRRPAVPTSARLPGLLALALTSTSIAFAAMFLSPGHTSAGIASVLGNLQPLFVLVLAAVFLGETLTGAKVLALGTGLAGVTLISVPAIAAPDVHGISGSLLALGASASLAVGNVILKSIGDGHDLLTMTAWQLILGGLPLLVLASLFGGGGGVSWTPEFVALLVSLALAGTAAPYLAWNHLARREEIGRLSLVMFLVPAIGVGLAAAIFGERFGTLELVGLAALAAAAVMASVSRGSPALAAAAVHHRSNWE